VYGKFNSFRKGYPQLAPIDGLTSAFPTFGVMPCRLVPFLLLIFSWCFAPAQSIPLIGQWREHLPFNNAISVSAEVGQVWCATPYGYFHYDESSNTFDRKTKVNGLHEVKVSIMGRDAAGGRVALGYENSDLDIIDGDRVFNIPDIMLSPVNGNKQLITAIWSESKLLLGTGLGIIVVDPDKREISDTWRIGDDGTEVPVTAIAIHDGYIYACCRDGLKRGIYPGANLADPAQWEKIQDGVLAAGGCQDVAEYSGKLFVLKNDSLFTHSSTGWRFLYQGSWPIVAMDATLKGIALCASFQGKGKVDVLDDSGSLLRSINTPSISDPRQATASGEIWWIADKNNGLLRVDGDQEERTFPNSPISTADGQMLHDGNSLWVAAGSVNEAWNYRYNPNGIYRFSDDYWAGINLYAYPKLDTLLDIITLAKDPLTNHLLAGSYGGGLLDVDADNGFKIYKQGTGLQSAIGDPGSFRVSGLAYDRDGNLWIANYGAPQELVLRKVDGSWSRYDIPFLHEENALSQLTFDDNGYLWMESPKGNGVFVYDRGPSLESTGDDRWRYLRQGKGSGNLPSSDVRCLAKDRDGFIWIGTANGICVMQCMNDIFTDNSCEVFLPVVTQAGISAYLFQGETVQAITVDGANRKWVGTRNGAWLISADGEKTLEHFTEINSPLLSNDVNHIAIDPKSGEVFFSTFNGICSFRGTATVADSNKSSVLVFPNPVPPGFNGTIAIRGLPENAWVRITELDGRLVHQTRSLGGQAVWNGRNYKGEKVSSGAYLVLATDADNREKVMARIFFIR